MGVEQSIEGLAAQQFGVFGRVQATGIGVTRRMIGARLESGRWDAVLPRVYRVAAVRSTFRQRAMAAALWAGPSAFVSHQAAAALWDLEGVRRPSAMHVTTVGRRRLRHKAVVVHSTADLIAADHSMIGPIAVTSPLRTALDLAAGLDALSLEILVEGCLRRGLFSVGQIRWRSSDRSGKGVAGSAVIRELLARHDLGRTDSGWEVRVAEALTTSGLPEPVRQLRISTPVGERHVDLAYPGMPVIAFEYDSDEWHFGVRRRHDDAARRNALRVAGCVVIEVTPGLMRDRDLLVGLARNALEARAA